MNDSFSSPASWSRTRWSAAFAVALIVQVLLIYGLSDRNPIVARRAASAPTHYLVAGPPANPALAELASLGDPTLFVLPGLSGFSGPAWLRPRPLVYPVMDPIEPPRWLTQNVADLGAVFNAFVRSNVIAHRTSASKPAPHLSQVNPSPIPLPTNSSVFVEGDLASRALLTPLDVPSIPHTDILTNTVVRLAVNASGFALFPAVLSSSGSKAADQQALSLAKSTRFNPLGPADPRAPRNPTSLTWGTLVFQWHTLEPTATNPPAANPPP